MSAESTSREDLLACQEGSCEATKKVFATANALRQHRTKYHGDSYEFSFVDDEGKEHNVTVNRKDGKLYCPFCTAFYHSSSSLKYHVEKRNCSKTVDGEKPQSDSEDNDRYDLDLVAVGTTSKTLTIQPKAVDTRRSFDQAVIQACQSQDTNFDDQQMTGWVLKKIGLEPYSMLHRDERNRLVEYNGLSHRLNVQGMAGGTFECSPIIPTKRKAQDSIDDHRIPEQTLGNMIHRSPYKTMLMRNTYHELDSSMAALLNQDWDLHPEAKYVCAQLLAGAIMLNSDNKAILINTIEIYGRTKTVDIHREMNSGGSSMPPDNLQYPNVYPTKLRTNEGSKLVIGMQTCNGLVTSRLRLDIHDSPKVGPVSSAFDVDCETKIYVDEWSMKKASSLNDPKTRSVEPFHYVYQARQIRSHFSNPTSYFLCRASSFLSHNFDCQPFTVFTLANSEGVIKSTNSDSACIIASRIFKSIIVNVIKSPDMSTLNKAIVKTCFTQCPGSQIKNCLKAILDQFDDADVQDISVLGNKRLNKELTKIADHMKSDISRLNGAIVANIEKRIAALNK